MAVCEPVFERWLIDDTFACRPGKGLEAAVVRASAFSRRWPGHPHLDVRQCFDSIPHDRLLELLEKRFKDRRLLDLFHRIPRPPGVHRRPYDAADRSGRVFGRWVARAGALRSGAR